MIYLDYAANTPVEKQVLDIFNEISTQYIANPNASHQLGLKAKMRLAQSTTQIAQLLGVAENEIIYTSGATESNNLAIKGVANHYKRNGKHIITTYLEHASVTSPIMTLQNQGYEVDFVDIDPQGQVDLDHLKELLRPDTLLVSICYVDSELGIRQPIHEIGELLKDYPNCFFHVDATQAIGKIPVTLESVDLISFAPHKFYGLNGCGVLIKKDHIILEPIIHGGVSTTQFRSGSPTLALIASIERALELSIKDLEQRHNTVSRLRELLEDALRKYPLVHINSTNHSIPHILNFSLKGKGISAKTLQEELQAQEIYIATKAACSTPGTLSRPVYAVTKDRKIALNTLRISLSHLTTEDEITSFLQAFDQCYQKYTG